MQDAVESHYSQEQPTFVAAVTAEQFTRMKFDSNQTLVKDSATGNDHVGVTLRKVFTAGDHVAIQNRNCDCVQKGIAAGAISARSKIYKAANGKVDDSGTVPYGIALTSTDADGEVIEFIEIPSVEPAATVAAVSTTNASDASTAATLANQLKTTLNSLITELKAVGIVAGS